MVFSTRITPYTATLGGLSGFPLQMAVATIGKSFEKLIFPPLSFLSLIAR